MSGSAARSSSPQRRWPPAGRRRGAAVAVAADGATTATAATKTRRRDDDHGARGAGPRKPRHFHRIDVHTHIGPDGIGRAVRLMDEWGIDGVVNLSGSTRDRRARCSRRSCAAAARERRPHRRVHDAQLQAGALGKGYGEAWPTS